MSDLHNLKRVLLELPEVEQKRIAIQAGILDIESVLDEAIDREENWIDPDSGHYYEESELGSYGYTHQSEINCQDNFELVLEALDDLHRADSDDQERLILKVLQKQDAISEATALSAILHNTNLNIRAIDTETLEEVLELLRNPFNAELAEKIHGETNEIGF